MSFSLHPAAEAEFQLAATGYGERAGRNIALAFLAEFERLAELLASNPGLGTPARDGLRIHPMRRFPYSLVYRGAALGIRILVVAHQHRQPEYWRGRA